MERIDLPGFDELVERALGPDEGTWEVTWVSSISDDGRPVRSKRHFRLKVQAEMFVEMGCGLTLTDRLLLLEKASRLAQTQNDLRLSPGIF